MNTIRLKLNFFFVWLILVFCISHAVYYYYDGFKSYLNHVDCLPKLSLDENLYHQRKVSIFNSVKSSNMRFVFIGDSHIDSIDFNEHFDLKNIVNRGISGDSSEEVLNRIHNNHMYGGKAFLLVGINDLRSCISFDNITSNYNQILGILSKSFKEVYILSVINVNENVTSLNIQVDLLNMHIKSFAKNNIHYIDLNQFLAPKGFLLDKYTIDGIHLTGAGYLRLIDAIKPYIYNSSSN